MDDASTETSASFKYPAKRASAIMYQISNLSNLWEHEIEKQLNLTINWHVLQITYLAHTFQDIKFLLSTTNQFLITG